VTTATVAGAEAGYGLAWALALGVAVTFVLQEAVARVAVVSGRPLGSVLREDLPGPHGLRRAVAYLAVLAVAGGAAAFQAGNLLGATLALQLLEPGPGALYVVALADAAFLLLWLGGYGAVEGALKVLVGAMTAAFLATVLLVDVSWGAVAAGLVPSGLGDRGLLVVALLGTTVVPYNLFLHSSMVREKGWTDRADLPAMRFDAAAMAVAGGLASGSILVASGAVLEGATVTGAGDMARQLTPAAGPAASTVFAVGLAAAGVTSALTAPLAAAYAVRQVLGWDEGMRGPRTRGVWATVLVAGAIPAALAAEPVPAIVAAQALNGALLPVLAGVVLWAANARGILGEDANGLAANAAGLAALAAAILLGVRLLASSLGL
jgi:NRAMP (natural resistance-associated macrophage protein)-like metal ion transporter